MAARETIFEIRDLHVGYDVYGGRLKVLNGVSLSVDKGERMGLVGEAGCGKTTTLKTVLGILPRQAVIESGQVLYAGQDVLKMRHEALQSFRRNDCAMIFQDPSSALNPVFTIGDQLRNGIRYSLKLDQGEKWQKAADELAIKALTEVMLPDPRRIMESYPFQLSGGMRQRVCIAMAIASHRNLLLADEPTTSLDVTIQEQILELIGQLSLSRGLSVVLVTHSMGVVRQMTDRVSVMYAGSIIESGVTRQVLESPIHPYTQALIACIPKLTGQGVAQGIPGRIPDYLNPPQGCRYAERCPQASDICRKDRPLLADAAAGHQVACHHPGR